MKPLVEEWLVKAEGDFNAAGREVRVRKNPAYHVACFLAQQSAEKYPKALLEYHTQDVPRTHGLIDLLALCRGIDPSLEILRSDLQELERYAVRVRYPGTPADKEDAQSAYRSARAVREFLRQRLGLPQTERTS